MPDSYVNTKIDDKPLKLTNLEKVLYPEPNITKAEFIQYYLSHAALLLSLSGGHPITLIRYPEGVNADRFYSKNLPDWTPDWISRYQYPNDDNQYLVYDQAAAVVWAANLAALEMHSAPIDINREGLSTYFIFDLDPPETSSFDEVKQLAKKLKPFLESYGYKPYLKTSGSKGLHLYVPILPIYSQDTLYQSVKQLAESFIKNNPETTLVLSKEKRQGRVLLDIYRNHKAQTCAIPYSTRAKPNGAVSSPMFWEDLDDLSSSDFYTIRNIDEYLQKGEPWKDFYTNPAPLHDQVQDTPAHVKEALEAYNLKRDFKLTNEPQPIFIPSGSQTRYVVQMHDATNLHYDLRLEKDGVLYSWAIPKGLPHDPTIKRLAIATEPHPLNYLTFEGRIPEGQYGAGQMWVFDQGNYTSQQWTDSKIEFTLINSNNLRSYHLFRTKDGQWLITFEGVGITPISYAPMLATASKEVPSASLYTFEVKWDGIRVSITKKGDTIAILSRGGNDITNKFPLIQKALIENIKVENCIMDGEIVVLDATGKPIFGKVVGRMHLQGESQIAKAAVTDIATLYLFDALEIDGYSIVSLPLERRRDYLRTIIDVNTHLRFSESFDDGIALFEGAIAMGLEGVMAKAKGSKYYSGQRNGAWTKIKVRTELEVFIIGYTRGEGDRSKGIGALHVAEQLADGTMNYKGKVGTGFDAKKLEKIGKVLDAIPNSPKPKYAERYEEKESFWKVAEVKAWINYASLTPDGILREPVFIRLSADAEEEW